MSEATEKVYKFIDDVTDPKIMTKEGYRDFLGELIDDLNGRFEAVVDELGARSRRTERSRRRKRRSAAESCAPWNARTCAGEEKK